MDVFLTVYSSICNLMHKERQRNYILPDHDQMLLNEFYQCFISTALLVRLKRFSFECAKVIGFEVTTLRDWLKRFAPLFHPIRSKTKTNCVIASRALRQLHVITSSFDWFTVLSGFFVIG